MGNKIVTIMLTLALALWFSGEAEAASAKKIDKRVREAIAEFKDKIVDGEEILARAAGVLVFPKVTKIGIGIGGSTGEGALLINGKTVAYYKTSSVSIGFQLGAQTRKQFLLFMTADALENFQNSSGWEVGADASVALVDVGAGGKISSESFENPVIAFVLSNKGLMYNLTLEGSKIKKIKK